MKTYACTITVKTIKARINIFIISIAAIFVFGLIIATPDSARQGAASGLKLCAAVIIPSIFPCSVIAVFLTKSKTADFFKKLLTPIGKITILGADAVFVILLSLISGYPVGAKLVSNLYSQKRISESAAKRLICLCVNPGPAFCILAVGKGVLSNVKCGVLLFASSVLSSIILNLIFNKREKFEDRQPVTKQSFSESFAQSVTDAASATFSICAFVVFISCVTVTLSVYMPYGFSYLITVLSEVTVGVLKVNGNIFLTAFLIGFGGFCVHAQVFAAATPRPKYSEFLLFRLLSGILCALILKALLLIFPVSAETAAQTSYGGFYATLPCFISLAVTVAVFIISAKKQVEKTQKM